MASDDPSAIALASCLEVLRIENERGRHAKIVVHDAWIVGPLGFCVIYERQSYPGKIGLYSVFRGGSYGVDRAEDPAGYGGDVAYFTIIEPLGSLADHLRPDESGISWITRPPAD